MKSIIILKHKNPSIKIGDKVYIKDGSGLSLLNDESTKRHLIINSYPKLTGTDRILLEIKGTVLEIGIKNIVSNPCETWCHELDCIVQLGNAKFRTCTGFLDKVEYTENNNHINLSNIIDK